MANTTSHTTRNKLRENVEWLSERLDAGIPEAAFTQAVRSFLTALDYEDYALMRSRLYEAAEPFRLIVQKEVQKRLEWPEQARLACRKIRDSMNGCVCDNWDDLGRAIEGRFTEMLGSLIGLREGAVGLLEKYDQKILNASELDSAIKDLQDLKSGVLDDWPWSDRNLPPADWQMVIASRAARERGEVGERIEDLIRRLGGTPAKNN